MFKPCLRCCTINDSIIHYRHLYCYARKAHTIQNNILSLFSVNIIKISSVYEMLKEFLRTVGNMREAFACLS